MGTPDLQPVGQKLRVAKDLGLASEVRAVLWD